MITLTNRATCGDRAADRKHAPLAAYWIDEHAVNNSSSHREF